MTMRPPVIFLSYRRQDTGPFALALRAELELRLDGVPIFLDISRIQGGDLWANVLDDALTKATILIALIGPNWIGEAEGQPSRMESDDDWVRREVARALRHPSGAVLPVLVNDAPLPSRESLPEDLWRIREFQAIPLRADSWNSDVTNLCQVLDDRFSVRVKRLDELLPMAGILAQLEERLSDKSLEETRRKGLLEGWEVEIIHDARKTGFVREFLRKRFACKSDEQAFEFVNKMMPIVRLLDHHPVIDMVYETVLVKLSTFDAGHNITTIDRKMAVEIDKLFESL